MAMGNEPVNPSSQSNDKQNEDAVAKLLALAAVAGLAWWARKRTQARQVAESQKTDPSPTRLTTAEYEKISNEMMEIHKRNMGLYNL